MVTQQAGPETPNNPTLDAAIESSGQDHLSRSLFVERLADSLIDPATHRATGNVLGIAGEWGSGKSSILNLVEAQISQTHQAAIVFRFNPWLIAETKDLIAEFFDDFLALVRDRIKDRNTVEEIEKRLNDYLDIVASIGDAKFPGVGKVIKYFQKRFLTRTKTAKAARKELIAALRRIPHPVVIIVDELDRVSDAEIKVMVQLVKSIADFPNVSYLIAYDAKRVAEALGNNDVQRGQPYLEKIVQLQIPLPILFREEVDALIVRTLKEFSPPQLLPDGWETEERFLRLLEALSEAGIDTPRAIKRIVGHFAIIGRMIGREVGWIDLIGYSALLAVAPQSVTYMRTNVDAFVSDTQDPQGSYADWASAFRENLPETRTNSRLWHLFLFLFPVLDDNRLGGHPTSPPDSIAHRRVLLTALRLGLLPGAFSAEDIQGFLSLSDDEKAVEVRRIADQGKWDQFQERLMRWFWQ